MEYLPTAHEHSFELRRTSEEEQQCWDPADPLHFEMVCLPLTSSAGEQDFRGSAVNNKEIQLRSNAQSVADGRKLLLH